MERGVPKNRVVVVWLLQFCLFTQPFLSLSCVPVVDWDSSHESICLHLTCIQQGCERKIY